MNDTELECAVAKQEEQVKKMKMDLQGKEKEVEDTRQVLKQRKKLYARMRKQKQQERRIRMRLEELNKEKADLDEMVSQVRRCILKHLSTTSLFTKYNRVS